MTTLIKYIDLGLIEYNHAKVYQQKLFEENLEIKKQQRLNPEIDSNPTNNFLLLCTHPHVYTLGKSGSVNNLLVNEEFLKNKGATFYKTDRGGDITYHGPGQIVGYPILDLESFSMGIKEYVYHLEKMIIELLIAFNLHGERLKNATGVWLDAEVPGKSRKICAMGVKASRHITMHGFALNVNTDLDYFNYINPCGFTNKSVTSLEKETGIKQDIEFIKEKLKNSFEKVFDARLI